MSQPPTILFALPDQHLAAIFARQFTHDGWLSETVATLTEAELRAVQLRPNVIIFDATVITQAAALAAEIKRLKNLPTLLKTKLIVLGDAAHMRLINDALAAGATDYILLPHLTPNALVARLRRLL